MTVRVAVNLMWCVPGDVGGSEQYLVRQLLGLDECGESDGVTVYGPAALASAHPRLPAAFPFVAAPVDGRSRWRRMIAESGWLHRRTEDAALVHHGGGTAPIRARRPYVLTIHDLQHRTFPQYVTRTKRAYLDAVVPRSARKAAMVTVPSQYVRGTVVAQLAVDPERVAVVPHGYEPALLEDVAPEDELRRRYALGDDPIVVYPAMTAPHKNHKLLLDLVTKEWRDRPHRLVLFGGTGHAEAEIATRIDGDELLRRRVVRVGRVSDADRNGLLTMADALVFPSEYEGFGAPVIEAMALGTPVVCSDATCLPDVTGGAAIVLPLDRDAWAGALDDVARRRDELVAAGRARVTTFTSAASGRALADVYDRVLAG
jgi:alpha-1,3-rhamnosyl/mannosyltransferase